MANDARGIIEKCATYQSNGSLQGNCSDCVQSVAREESMSVYLLRILGQACSLVQKMRSNIINEMLLCVVFTVANIVLKVDNCTLINHLGEKRLLINRSIMGL